MPVTLFNSPAGSAVASGATPAAGITSAGASGTGLDLVSAPAGAVMAYDNAYSVNGGCDFLASTSTDAATPVYVGWSTQLGTQAQAWFRMSLHFAVLPSVQHQILGMISGGSRAADISVTPSGRLLFRDQSGTTILTTANAVPVGSRFRIEGWVTTSPATGQMHIELYAAEADAVPLEQQTSAAAQNTLTSITQVRFGMATGVVANISAWRFGNIAVSPSGPIGPGAIVQQMVAGAPVQDGFTVVSKPVGATSARLKVATDQALTQDVTWAGAQVPDGYGYVRHAVTGLAAHTQYYCQLADTPGGGTEALVGPVGQRKTLPPAGAPASFTVSLASCIDSGGNTDSPTAAIDDWTTWNADIPVFTGDFDYEQPTATDMPDQIADLEAQVATFADGGTGSLRAMLAKAWGYYIPSDHETGPDNGDSDTAYMPYNIAARQELFPVPTADAGAPPHGLYTTWVAGRVRFIMLDVRNTDRSPGAAADNASKTMLGATQLAWFKSQLTQAEPLKVVISDSAWMGAFLGTDLDKWWAYDTERQAILAFIAANKTAVRNIMWWHGDSHALATATPAQNAAWGGFPVYCAAPLKQTGAAVPNVAATFGQYYNAGGGDCRQYARITFTDDGYTITSSYTGWDALHQVARITQTDTFSAFSPGILTAATSSGINASSTSP